MFDRFKKSKKPEEILREAASSVERDAKYPGSTVDLAAETIRREIQITQEIIKRYGQDKHSQTLLDEYTHILSDLENGGHNTSKQDTDRWAMQAKFRRIREKHRS